jgi:adenylate cyclase
MKRAVIFLLLLLPLFAHAKQHEYHIPVFTKDSFNIQGIRYSLDEGWKFYEGDSAAMALVDYDDSKWDTVNATLRGKKNHNNFSSICWLRRYIITDSSLTGHVLALAISHLGASEIYFDGKKISSFGIIDGRNSGYCDPQYVPFPLIVTTAGPHVIAVRYANYDAEKDYKIYNSTFRGFHMNIEDAKYSFRSDRGQTMLTSVIYILLFGIFISLAMSHLFLYLYYRALKSNLYFSIFCFSLSIGFLEVFLNRLSLVPGVQLVNMYVTLVVVTTACLSLSGFTNELFSIKKLRFRSIQVFCLVCPFIWIINIQAGIVAYFILIGTVLVQTIILTIIAIYKKVKGARIIGAGLLFFALFIFTMLIISLTGVSISENSPVGRILLFTAACAILSIPVSLSLYLAWSFAGINKNLKAQLQQVELLSDKNLQQEQEKKRILENQKEKLEEEVAVRTTEVVAQKEKIEKQHEELKIEKKKSDDLLLNILPEEIAEELKETGHSEARFFNNVTVLFTDFVNFTAAGERMTPQELVDELHTCFKTFDEIISKYHIEKIKTIGDAYLAVCGLPMPVAEHAANVVRAALEIKQFMADRKQLLKDKVFEVRIGIHSGSVVAGIVGVKKFAYDIWGDTVNTAARMEQNSEAGKINISQTTYELVKDQFICAYRGEINAKNKGELSMYFVDKQVG